MLVNFTDFYDSMNEAFWPFFESKARVRVSYGGAGSSKSYSCFQDIIYKLVSEPGHNFLICRKVAVTSKTSTFALALQVINDMGLNKLFKINKSDLSITVKLTGYMAVFKGLDDIEKLKSITFPKGILTDVVVEEASEITQADFNQLNVRLRGKKPKGIRFQITLLLNPISDQHWIKREFLDLKSYQKSISVYLLHTTYLDNEFIDEDYRAVLEGYKDIDYEFYRVYCLGEWGTFGDIIFTNWKFAKCPYTENDFDSVYAGQDFGFKHPQVIVKVGFKDGKMYTFKELCVFEKTNKEIIDLNAEYNIISIGERITCDSAEPSKIKEWIQHGYGAVPAVKGPDSVSRGIDYIRSQEWYIDPDACPRTAQEVQTYHYKKNKNGEIDKKEGPVEIDDDAIAAHRYALETLSKAQGKPSILSGTKSEGKKEILEVLKAQRKERREIIKKQVKQRREENLKNQKK